MGQAWYHFTPKVPKLYSALSLGCSMRLRNRESAYPIEDWDDREIAVYGPHDFVEQDLLFGPPSCFILVSQRLRGLVEKSFPGEVNFYGVRLQRVDGSGERGGYSLGQVLQKADCIDTDRTEGTWRESDGQSTFWPFHAVTTVRPGFSTPHNIFRPMGQSAVIYVSEEFKTAVEQARLTGCQFTPLPI